MNFKHLRLYTSCLQDQLTFYKEVLGFDCIQKSADSFTFDVGESKLTFSQAEGNPYYHFAFNIPSNQIEEALKWAESKVTVLPDENDPILNFEKWEAHSLYFHDPANNIVEFISRKNIYKNIQGPFKIENIINLSEIGIPVESVTSLSNTLQGRYQIPHFDGNSFQFCALGNDNGLFIIIDSAEKKWIPAMDEAIAFPFEIEFEHKKNALYLMQFEDGRMTEMKRLK